MANPLTINILFTVLRRLPEIRGITVADAARQTAAWLAAASLVTGCATAPPPSAVATPVVTVAPAVPAVLSAEADAALKAAELSVNEARLKRALWTAAVKQLGLARDAARVFDSATTLSHAREAIALCNLSLQQLSAPPVKW